MPRIGRAFVSRSPSSALLPLFGQPIRRGFGHRAAAISRIPRAFGVGPVGLCAPGMGIVARLPVPFELR